jgi:predicted secreted protein
MSVPSGIVLFAVIWFMVLFITLPFGLRTQGDEGKVEPGTNPGSPANFKLKRTALIVTAISVVVWAIIAAIILSGVIKISELGWI